MKINKLFLILVIVFTNCIWAQSIAEWHTSMGSFQVMLREDLVPITAGNFMDLTNSNFYDGLIFHRVIADFMIQDGCPYGTGYGGPGYTIPDEFHPDLLFDEPGVIGMANTGSPNSAGSQYFITVVPTSWLNWSYAAFGNVIQGMDVVNDISVVPTTGAGGNPPNKPLIDVDIDSIRIVTPQLYAIIPEDDSLYIDEGESIVFGVLSDDENLEYFWYIDDVLQDESDFIFSVTFENDGEYIIESIVFNGNYEYPTAWYVFVNNTNIEEQICSNTNYLFQNTPNPFNPETIISFNVIAEDAENAELVIYNLKGQKVKQFAMRNLKLGMNKVVWNGTDDSGKSVSSGIYFYELKSGDYQEIRKMILLK
ncbi:MAG: peptidylprolyl isomerase [Armatimonadetes bacterium]|nr:peptidylprolyl isomerase [Armatimonadota bacterium]